MLQKTQDLVQHCASILYQHDGVNLLLPPSPEQREDPSPRRRRTCFARRFHALLLSILVIVVVAVSPRRDQVVLRLCGLVSVGPVWTSDAVTEY